MRREQAFWLGLKIDLKSEWLVAGGCLGPFSVNSSTATIREGFTASGPYKRSPLHCRLLLALERQFDVPVTCPTSPKKAVDTQIRMALEVDGPER